MTQPLNKLDFELSDQCEFFIAVCHEKRWPHSCHSLILIGAKDSKTKQTHLLNACGKYLDLGADRSALRMLLESLFHEVPSKLHEEHHLYEDEKTSLTYQAYQLPQSQYETYLSLVNGCRRSSYFGAYHEIATENGKHLYHYDAFNPMPTKDDRFNQTIKKLGIKNTCRHAALEILNHLVGKLSALPTFFLSGFHYKAVVSRGQIHNDIFIFPIPPERTQCSKESFPVLLALYKRLQQVSRTLPSHPKTMEKFDALKKIYLELYHPEHQTLEKMMSAITNWEKENQKIIDAKRGFSLFKATKTHKVIHKISEDLKNRKKKKN